MPFTQPGDSPTSSRKIDYLAPVPPMNRREASSVSEDIRQKKRPLWHYVHRANEGRAFEALGYASWKDYIANELQLSESRSFQLLDKARVMREMAAAGVDPDDVEAPSRVVQSIKSDLPAVRTVAAEALKRGEDVTSAIRAYAAQVDAARSTPKAPRKSEAKTVVCPCCEGSGRMTAREALKLKRRLGMA